MKQFPCSKPLQQLHQLPTPYRPACVVLLRAQHSQTTTLIGKYETLETWSQTTSHGVTFRDFYPADKKYQTKLCSTAVSLPGSSQQGLGLSVQVVEPCLAGQLSANKRNPLLGICSLHTAATRVSREIWPSAACSNLCTFAGVTRLLHMTSGKAKALPGKCVSDTTQHLDF